MSNGWTLFFEAFLCEINLFKTILTENIEKGSLAYNGLGIDLAHVVTWKGERERERELKMWIKLSLYQQITTYLYQKAWSAWGGETTGGDWHATLGSESPLHRKLRRLRMFEYYSDLDCYFDGDDYYYGDYYYCEGDVESGRQQLRLRLSLPNCFHCWALSASEWRWFPARLGPGRTEGRQCLHYFHRRWSWPPWARRAKKEKKNDFS